MLDDSKACHHVASRVVHAENAEPSCKLQGVQACDATPFPSHQAAEPALHDPLPLS